MEVVCATHTMLFMTEGSAWAKVYADMNCVCNLITALQSDLERGTYWRRRVSSGIRGAPFWGAPSAQTSQLSCGVSSTKTLDLAE